MNRNVVTLVNRTSKAFNFTFGGVSYTVPADDEISVLEDVANHARKKSIMSYDLETGRALYQVGIAGTHDVSKIGAGKESTDELIDRNTDIMGKPTKINVRGGQVAPSREEDVLAGREIS